MKNKLLLFLLFHLLLGSKLIAKNLVTVVNAHNVNLEIVSKNTSFDTIKKHKRSSRVLKTVALLTPPATTAGSSCGDGINPSQVNVYAFGSASETIEWFASQTSASPIFTGNVYSPSIITTKTYYVRSRSGSDVSIRVPVVASIYFTPPSVTLSASPVNDALNPLCLGTSVTFTASGGADLFEFSVDGVVMQSMSPSKIFTTNVLTDGQVVRVRTRYQVSMDGSITERTWGTGALEDNFLSAPLSVNASTGYINSLKISASENKLVLGISGKVLNNRSILLFLDTKAGGFNVSNYGDELDSDPLVRSFNLFNNNPSTFDSYFQADYCLVISTDAGETNYYANVIELKTGTSIKTYVGSAATGFPSAVMGVNKNNSGINDYNLGFEVEVLKSLIGYTTGDIKFFGLTMNDKEDGSQAVTNSFLSPERSSNLDYGIGSVDYNLKDPNPVVVSSTALTPCYSEANIMMNFVSIPTTISVVQPTCAINSGAIIITTQPGIEYSLNGGAYQDSNEFFGLAQGSYILNVRKKTGSSCVISSSDPIVINAVPVPPTAPTALSVVQPTCGVPSGSIAVATQSVVEYSLNGTTYQSSNSFTGLAKGNYTLYVRNQSDNSCATPSVSVVTINAVSVVLVPTALSVVQPTCGVPSGSIAVATQSGVEYSLNGTTYQTSNTFTGLAKGNYTLYVRNLSDNSCLTPSASVVTINAVPSPPTVPTASSVVQPTCGVPSGSISVTTQLGVEYSLNGTTYQTSNTFTGLSKGNYTLYVKNQSDNSCVTPSASVVTINAVPTPPTAPTASSVVQPTCGVPSGSIAVATQSGVEYSLNGTTYQTSNTFTGLSKGNYTLYVRNQSDNSCITPSVSVVTINTVPTPPTAPTASSVVQPTCGVPSGSIAVATQSGVEYSLNGTTYQSSNSFTGLSKGNYTLYVRNQSDNSCVTPSALVITINAVPTPPTPPTALSVVQPTCGVPSGSIAVATQSGVEYSLNGTTYQSSNSFTGLAKGNYTLYVRNLSDNSCVTPSASVVTINAVPTPPTAPTASSVVQPTCGVPSGSIAVATQSGVEYSLNGTTYQTSNTFIGLSKGDYTLYVRNLSDNSCVTPSALVVTINAIPTPPTAPTASSVVQPTCGVPSGSIAVATQSGVEYSLNGTTYQTSNSFTGLSKGNYTLYVRNLSDNSCVTPSASVITINAVPTPPTAPTALSVVQPTCGVPSGSIAVTTQLGVEYSLNGTTYQTSNTFTGLAKGNYTLYVRNQSDNSCVTPSASVVTINAVPTPPTAPTALSVVQPTCGVPSGSIAVATQSGVEYSLNGTTYQSSNTFTGLAKGNYTLYVRNLSDNSCITPSVSVVTINAVPTPPTVPTALSVVQPTCGVPSGSIAVATQSGVEYSLNGTTYQTTNTFTGLSKGNYTLYVRNQSDNSCITPSVSVVTINAVPVVLVPTALSVVQPTCGVPSGSIAVATQSGVEYSLNGTTYQTSNTFTGLSKGDYTLYVRNQSDNSCVTPSASVVTINAVPTPPTAPTALSVVQPTCGVPSGSIAVATQSGVEYSLNGTTYQTTNTFTGLSKGDYALYVRNQSDNSCITPSVSVVTINAVPTPPTAPTALSVVQPTCGVPSGSIAVATQSGVEYSLNGTTYQTTNTFTGLSKGNYTLYVRNQSDNSCITPSVSVVTINAVPVVLVPTALSVVQPTCGVPSGSIAVATQSGVEYSLNGTTYQTSNTFTGLSKGDYTLYVRNLSDNSCVTPSASVVTINAVPTPPTLPTAESTVHPTCAVPSGTLVVAAQSGVEYSLNGITYQTSNVFSGLTPNNYVLYVRNITDNTCSVQSTLSVTINPLPPLPLVPTLVQIMQPTCLQPLGRIQIAAQANVQYSIGYGYQDDAEFLNLAPGKYTMSVRFTNSIACISTGSQITINPVPPQIQFQISGECDSKDYVLTASPISSSYDSNNVDYEWKDSNGSLIGTNSNILNVSDVAASTLGQVIFPIKYSLTVKSIATGCETTDNVTIESIYCNIQKGISPDGNGSNDYFDLRLMDVKNLEIFDRYGIKVYNQTNYTDQWKGQSNNGNELPSATYYYVIQFNNGETKTGWIYLIREK
ncbi:gliding motility-associated C-terminal domain-containing protein [Flavobacterium sp. 83]|uniref:gliding motility-associated C-terminal domain-containing protein n=1 Tax=Flavobacterium sp. 83 TaxID=1131812 RepID=UPI00054F2DC9|nr:T9SS C-terminal target domain-containing protein [Flavobacterium sp. 83]